MVLIVAIYRHTLNRRSQLRDREASAIITDSFRTTHSSRSASSQYAQPGYPTPYRSRAARARISAVACVFLWATVSSIQTANLPAFDDAACAAILAQLADSEGN